MRSAAAVKRTARARAAPRKRCALRRQTAEVVRGRNAQVRREVQEIDMSIMREAMDKRVLGLPQARPAIPHFLSHLPQADCLTHLPR